jgi:hypothetical protein
MPSHLQVYKIDTRSPSGLYCYAAEAGLIRTNLNHDPYKFYGPDGKVIIPTTR